MTPKAVTTQEQIDHMEQEARYQSNELFGEWLKEFYGDRGVPGMPAPDQQPPDMQGVMSNG